jgi:glutamate racemase
MQHDVKALVIACNTASAVSVDMLNAELDIPVIGVVEPGARAAATALGEATGQARIGILGTVGTIRSGAYPRAVARHTTRAEVLGSPAPLLVPLVEEGWLTGDVPRLAVERYLRPLIDAEVRVIVLGCTHYPLLKDLIYEVATKMAQAEIVIVDSAEATALATAELLAARGLSNPDGSGELRLLVTDRPDSFEISARRFLGEEVPSVDQVDIPMAPLS